MGGFDFGAPVSRRKALALGGAAAGGLLVASSPLGAATAGAAPSTGTRPAPVTEPADGSLPTKAIEELLQAQGSMSGGVFTVQIERQDLPNATLNGDIPFKPAWEDNGSIVFQSLGAGKAIINCDFPCLVHETNGFIDALLEHRLVFQAFHQHYMDVCPMVYFIHFRGVGNPLALAAAAHAAVLTTATPLPQTMPTNPTTPLPAKELGDILKGMPMVGSDGVVTVSVTRRDTITLGGIKINPSLNVETMVGFEPLSDGTTAVGPDFGMASWETQAVTAVMRAQGWQDNCLYNQETDEFPQLYFSHMVKVGDAVSLAHQIRRGLDFMDVTGSPVRGRH